MSHDVRAWDLARLAVVLLVFTAAPVAGDIGSCGQEAEDLDAPKFFAEKARIDCERCAECAIPSTRCGQACDPNLTPKAFPAGCYPYVHDGEVCLNALEAASCDDYQGYMAEQDATAPTECSFCPLEATP